jgi:hypothetical protein
VTIRDTVTVLRLAHEMEHDDALAEHDAARHQMEQVSRGPSQETLAGRGPPDDPQTPAVPPQVERLFRSLTGTDQQHSVPAPR